MQKILLTSAGFTRKLAETFLEMLNKKAEEAKILFIPAAASYRDDAREGIGVCAHELGQMGIKQEYIFAYNLDYLLSKGYERTYSGYVSNVPRQFRLLEVKEVLEFDAIVVCGGYSEFLLKQINRTGFDEVLKEAVQQGVPYVGISAGSMVAAGNFASGLKLIENAVQVHCEAGTPCGEITHDGIIELRNEQAILVDEGKKMVVGCL